MTTAAYGPRPGAPTLLIDVLKADLKTALMAKDELAKSTIRQIMAEFPTLTVPLTLSSGKASTRVKRSDEITDADIHGIVRRLIKAEETVLAATGAAESPYISFLSHYVPPPIGEADIQAWIADNIDLAALKSPNQAIGRVMAHFGKSADGRMVKQIIARLTAGG